WCDTDEPLVVVVMNNSVPPTVQSVSMEDRQRAPSREEGSVLVQPSLEATQDMCGAILVVYVCPNIEPNENMALVARQSFAMEIPRPGMPNPSHPI
ncbi:hypothetical protein JOQ06_016151, partial [Pogonophryne albipinna]